MRSNGVSSGRRLLLGVIALAVTASLLAASPVLLTGAPAQASSDGVSARLEGPLAELFAQATRLRASDATLTPSSLAEGSKWLADAIAARTLRIGAGGMVQVDVAIAGAGPDAEALAALGVVVERHRPDLGRAQYQAPATSLGALARLPGVRFVRLPTYARTTTGSTLSEGDAALRADAVRSNWELTGAGVRIGVISNGVRGLAESQASGDAPVLADQRAFDGDGLEAGSEGTAMIEIVHDLAPDAAISFANAATDLEMIEAVNYLAARNDIVVDDLGFVFPDDQQSAVSVNTAAALSNAAWPIRAYMTAVGNWARRHYTGAFEAGPDGRTMGLESAGAVHRFRAAQGTTDAQGEGPAPANEIFLDQGDTAFVVLFWDDPWGESSNNYDLYLLNSQNVRVAASREVQGVTNDLPRERLTFRNEGPAGRFRIVVQNFQDGAAARELELFAFFAPVLPGEATALNFNSAGSSMLAQSDAGGGVISVGAIYHGEPGLDEIQPPSSRGPTNNGAMKPDLTAVDGVSVTGHGGFGTTFFGTSAAAPHVAAVAALLLEARPSLLAASGGNPIAARAVLRALLTESAVDLGEAGADNTYGAGRLDAVLAVEQALSRVVSVSSDEDAGPDSFRAAIEAANDIASMEGDGDGGAGFAILFESALQIALASPLPALRADDATIDGAGSVVDGSALVEEGVDGLAISGARALIGDLSLSNFAGSGLHLDGAAGATLMGARVEGNGTGLLIDNGATDVTVGPGEVRGVVAAGNAGDGVVIAGEETGGVVVRNSLIGVDEGGVARGNGGAGVRIAAGAAGNTIGAGLADTPGLAASQVGEVVHTIQGTVTVNGLAAPAGTVVEAFLDGAAAGATVVGLVEAIGGAGFVLTISGPGETVTFEVDGVAVDPVVEFEPGAVTIVALAVSSAVAPVAPVDDLPQLPGANVIAFNAGNGIRVEGATSLRNTFRGNAIHSNGALAIDLVSPGDPASGVTPNDTADLDDGPNDLLNRVSIDRVSFEGDVATVEGAAEPGTTVDLYAVVEPAAIANGATGSGGAGGAVRLLATTVVTGSRFTISDLAVGDATALTALATDGSGNTSEFAQNVEIDAAPLISTVSPASGASGGGTPIRLEGTGFAADARVLFNGVDAVVVSAEATALEVRTPAGAVGPASVTVVNPQGRSFTLEGAFRYVTARVLTLQPGWNNVSWAGAPTPVTASINALAGRVDRVFAWDPERQVYDSFIVAAPSFLNTLSMLQRGQALWLFVTGEEPVRWEQPLVF